MFSLPKNLFALPSLLSIVPTEVNSKIFVATLNQVFSRPLQDGELCFLEGKYLKIEVLDFGLCFFIGLKSNNLIAVKRGNAADLIISANSCDYLSMIARKKDPDTLFFQRKIKMEGSTELGLYVKNFLDAFDVEYSFISSKIDKVVQALYPLLNSALSTNK